MTENNIDKTAFDIVFNTEGGNSKGGMDTIRAPRWGKFSRLILWGVFFLCVVGISIFLFRKVTVSTSTVLSSDKISMVNVERINFEEAFEVVGTFESRNTVSLSADLPGKVTAISGQSGALVKIGDPLFVIENKDTSLELGRARSEVARATSRIEDINVKIAGNHLDQKRKVLGLEGEIVTLINLLQGRRVLANEGFASTNSVEAMERDLAHKKALLTLETQAASVLAVSTNAQLENAKLMLTQAKSEESSALDAVKGLRVRATASGQLSGFDLKLGSSVLPGEEIAQIRGLKDPIASARVDEFYLSSMEIGQKAKISTSGAVFEGKLSHIESDITQGRFNAEWSMQNLNLTQTSQVEFGQSLRIRHRLGNQDKTLALPIDEFYTSRTGDFVFVLDDKGYAQKRSVTFGRKNDVYVEVTNGLSAGDTIIISDYTKINTFTEVRVK